ncbi:hypothetical protein GCM10023339_13960 [Alloalcanivorax gelatiniphagus]|tara:strand:- start:9335 stop:10744 length:1410 start_codon:yes stop_codon:yes gene_type:complete
MGIGTRMRPGPDPNSRGILARNLSFSVLSRLAQIGVSFFTVGLGVQAIGLDEWWIVATSLSVLSLVLVIQSGAVVALSRLLIENQKQSAKAADLYTTARRGLLGIGVFFLAGSALFAAFSSSPLRAELLVSMAGLIFTLLAIPKYAALYAMDRLDLHFKALIVASLCKVVAVVALYAADSLGVFLYCAVLAAEQLLIYAIVSARFSSLADPQKTLRSDGRFRGVYFREIFSLNAWLSLNSLSYALIITAPQVLLHGAVGPRSLSLYGVFLQLNNFTRGFFISFNASLGTRSSLHFDNQSRAFQALAWKGSLTLALASVLGFVAFLAVGQPLLAVWLGVSFDDLEFLLLSALFMSILYAASSLMLANLSVSVKRVRAPALAGLAVSVIGVFILLILKAWGVGELRHYVAQIVVCQVLYTLIKNLVMLSQLHDHLAPRELLGQAAISGLVLTSMLIAMLVRFPAEIQELWF